MSSVRNPITNRRISLDKAVWKRLVKAYQAAHPPIHKNSIVNPKTGARVRVDRPIGVMLVQTFHTFPKSPLGLHDYFDNPPPMENRCQDTCPGTHQCGRLALPDRDYCSEHADRHTDRHDLYRDFPFFDRVVKRERIRLARTLGWPRSSLGIQIERAAIDMPEEKSQLAQYAVEYASNPAKVDHSLFSTCIREAFTLAESTSQLVVYFGGLDDVDKWDHRRITSTSFDPAQAWVYNRGFPHLFQICIGRSTPSFVYGPTTAQFDEDELLLPMGLLLIEDRTEMRSLPKYRTSEMMEKFPVSTEVHRVCVHICHTEPESSGRTSLSLSGVH